VLAVAVAAATMDLVVAALAHAVRAGVASPSAVVAEWGVAHIVLLPVAALVCQGYAASSLSALIRHLEPTQARMLQYKLTANGCSSQCLDKPQSQSQSLFFNE
jgi:hypothetical protein